MRKCKCKCVSLSLVDGGEFLFIRKRKEKKRKKRKKTATKLSYGRTTKPLYKINYKINVRRKRLWYGHTELPLFPAVREVEVSSLDGSLSSSHSCHV
jgi:hypothetical protein